MIQKTEVVKNSITPIWRPCLLSEFLCGGYDAPIVVRVYDHDDDGTHVCSFLKIPLIFICNTRFFRISLEKRKLLCVNFVLQMFD